MTGIVKSVGEAIVNSILGTSAKEKKKEKKETNGDAVEKIRFESIVNSWHYFTTPTLQQVVHP